MKLTTLDEDLKIHQKLEDEPNDVGGLSAQKLKEKFDQAGLTIQKYLNEVHLPEEEQGVADALAEAKRYTDLKVVAIGSSDMASAVYDTKKKRQDVYEYADQRKAEAMARTAKLEYVFIGRCGLSIANGNRSIDSFQKTFDPRGLWSAEEAAFVAPEGAQGVVLTSMSRWVRPSYAKCYIDVTVNGEVTSTWESPMETTTGPFYHTLTLMETVQGGDKVGLSIRSTNGGSGAGQIELQSLRVEFIL